MASFFLREYKFERIYINQHKYLFVAFFFFFFLLVEICLWSCIPHLQLELFLALCTSFSDLQPHLYFLSKLLQILYFVWKAIFEYLGSVSKPGTHAHTRPRPMHGRSPGPYPILCSGLMYHELGVILCLYSFGQHQESQINSNRLLLSQCAAFLTLSCRLKQSGERGSDVLRQWAGSWGGALILFGLVAAALPSLWLGNMELYSAEKRHCFHKLSQFLYNL